MSSLKQRYANFCDFMEKNTKGVEIGIYGATGLLFAFAYYKIRPISKFGKASDIPRHFITKKIVQNGTVKAIEPNQSTGAILRVDHKPPINLLFASNKTLPVKLFGVSLNSNGFSWLQTITIDHPVEFLPINRKSDYAECQVKLIQDPALSKNRRIDVAEALISLGFATVDGIKETLPRELLVPTKTTKKDELKRYYDKLDKVQARAKRNRLGLWSAVIKPSPWPISTIERKLSNLVRQKVLPEKWRLPELVR